MQWEDLQWGQAQRVDIYGAECYIVEDSRGNVYILSPLAKVRVLPNRKSYEAEDVPNARARR